MWEQPKPPAPLALLPAPLQDAEEQGLHPAWGATASQRLRLKEARLRKL